MSALEAALVLTLVSLVLVPVLGLGTVDQRAAQLRLEQIERLAATRALADQLAADPHDLPPHPGREVTPEWVAARAPGLAFAPGTRVVVALEPDVENAAGLHRLTVSTEQVSVVRLLEGR